MNESEGKGKAADLAARDRSSNLCASTNRVSSQKAGQTRLRGTGAGEI
jgi:hypothetical protein